MLFDIALLEIQILQWVAKYLVCHRSIYFLLCFVSEQALHSSNALTLSGSFVLTCKRDDFLKHFCEGILLGLFELFVTESAFFCSVAKWYNKNLRICG